VTATVLLVLGLAVAAATGERRGWRAAGTEFLEFLQSASRARADQRLVDLAPCPKGRERDDLAELLDDGSWFDRAVVDFQRGRPSSAVVFELGGLVTRDAAGRGVTADKRRTSTAPVVRAG